MYKIRTMNSISPVWEQVLSKTEYEVGADIRDPQAYIVRSAELHGAEIPESLLCVGRAGAGYNNLPLEDYVAKGIVAFNTPGANANAVKELVLAGLLLGARDIAGGMEWIRTVKEAGEELPKLVEKEKKRFTGPELRGKTLGVIGLGAIGGPVANTAVALDMNVIGYDPYLSVDNAWRLSRAVSHAATLDEVLSRSDYVTLHVPLTDASRGSFNEDTFLRMKHGAVLLNFARGELVETGDLLSALASGQLRRYVTDFPNADLIGVPGVVAIPHLGASTPESEDNCVEMVARQIDLYLKTGAIRNSVNFPDCVLPPSFRHRICILHANVPNMVGRISAVIAGRSLNIDSMVNRSRGTAAYSVIDLDDPAEPALLDEIRALPEVWRVRSL